MFQIQRSTSTSGKKVSTPVTSNQTVTIHPQAAPLVSRHVLDALISLAKGFPHQFLSDSKIDTLDKVSKVDLEPNPAPGSRLNKDADFWDVLVKLDSLSTTKKGKNVLRSHSSSSSLNSCTPMVTDGSESSSNDRTCTPLGSIINLLSHPVIKRSSQLTDRLLRLLSLIATALPTHPDSCSIPTTTSPPVTMASSSTSRHRRTPASHNQPDSNQLIQVSKDVSKDPTDSKSIEVSNKVIAVEEQLKLAVDVLTSKSCSEEGLEDVTSLLLRLSRSCPKTRDLVLRLLLDGARTLGFTVCTNIESLIQELKELNLKVKELSEPSSIDTSGQSVDRKGMVVDRFTNQSVVITAPIHVKHTLSSKEVQLPSMAALTSKTSSQNFFLRILKVIIQLRDSIRVQKRKAASIRTFAELQQEITTLADSLSEVADAVESAQATSSGTSSRTTGSREGTSSGIGASDANVSRTIGSSGATSSGVGSNVSRSSESTSFDTSGQSQSMEVDPQPMKLDTKLDTKVSGEKQDMLSTELALDKLWDTLSECLLELADAPDHHAVLVLQPAVEAFFLVHASEKLDSAPILATSRHESGQQGTSLDIAPSSPLTASDLTDGHSSVDTLAPDTRKFLQFAETHKVVLNQILRQSTTPLVDGPFAVLVDHTRVLDFDVKRRYFRQELDRLDDGSRREDLAVHVRREHVFEDSFRELYRRTPEDWKNRFYIVFEGEEGQDAGGLLREWYAFDTFDTIHFSFILILFFGIFFISSLLFF